MQDAHHGKSGILGPLRCADYYLLFECPLLTQSGHSICPIGPPSNSISGLAGQILASKVAIMGGTLYVTIIGPGRCEAVNSGPCDAIEMGVV
jgi:hypothetical protein